MRRRQGIGNGHAPRLAAVVAAAVAVASLGALPGTPAHAGMAGRAVAAVGGGLEAAVSVASDRPTVHFSLTNTGSEPVAVLRWGTPLEGVRHDMFRVTRDGRSVTYTGPELKRGAPSARDYVVLQPGATTAADVDLAQSYRLTAAGRYSVTAAFDLTDVRRGSASRVTSRVAARSFTTVHAALAPVTFTLARGIPDAAQTPTPLSYTNCTVSDQAKIGAAYTAVQNMSSNALLALQNAADPASAPRYLHWFGVHTSTRYANVTAHYNAIVNLYTTNAVASIPWSCNNGSCDASTFAYVFPSDTTHGIHVCALFFSAALSGADSAPGTLIHEASHFSDIAGTSDFVYGQSGAAALAVSNPTNATNNADNHEYFAENPTGLTMGNSAPSAIAQSVTAPVGSATPITLTGSDPDSDPLTFSVATGPAHGTLGGSGAALTYTPTFPYAVADSFTFVVNDGQVNSSPATVSITISGGPAVPLAAIGSAAILEGDTGKPRAITFPVTLTQPATQLSTVNYSVVSTASAAIPADVAAKSGTLKFKPSAVTGLTPTIVYVTVNVVPDTVDEGDETFAVVLSNATGGIAVGNATGTGNIVDDDPAGTASTRASVGDVSIWEGNAAKTAKTANVAKVMVNLSAPATATVSVTVMVAVGSASVGTDVAKVFTKTLTFNAGQFQKPVAIGVLTDALAEGDETVSVTLSAPTGGLVLGRAAGTLTIRDDD